MTEAITETHRRERKHRRSMRRGVDQLMPVIENQHSYDQRSVAMADCAYRAVRSLFRHLSVDQIRQPPRQLMDAKLARQIAIHIMVHRLHMEQRQICRIQMRQRTSIHFALQAVETRLECEIFAAAYERIAAIAERLCQAVTMQNAA